ncbi:CobW family GTP-binding protein [Notoacmeibacter ruber]|uniref:GTP-binding protein n=1 Tax=Notoacmeibacter ruber TaxID=2670375 RepID=A0A3L7JEA1_9HYPH|nr:GTP-binding protein [Notoacmeibacter ruber]RLQ88645.1 GTP-binding protein [Notoacmeibacter ruber]
MKEEAPEKLPVILLTGFLGAGKTTFLNRLLADPAFSGSGVIVNEFGDVSLDGSLVETAAGGAVLEMAGGCLCCAGGGALEQTLADLIEAAKVRGRPLTRVVVETSGMADPLPILGEIGLSSLGRLEAVLTVVDLAHGERTLAEFEEARRQVAVADCLLLSKSELAGGMIGNDLEAVLKHLAPQAARQSADADVLSSVMAVAHHSEHLRLDVVASVSGEAGHDHHHHVNCHSLHRHRDTYATTVLQTERPLAPMALQGFLEVLVGTLGDRLLRVKGLAHLTNEDRPLIVQAVQGMVHSGEYLAKWPAGIGPQTALVVITQGHRAGEIENLFGAFTGEIAADRPDAAALTDNPLAVPGFSSF